MRVSSPIGELPFRPMAIRYARGSIEVDGAMGAWPAHVVIEASDVPAVLRLLAKPLAVLAGVTVVVGLAANRRRNR